MRIAQVLAVAVLLSAPAMAQDNASSLSPSTAGPIVDGKHRQPTEAEIQSRQRADGTSARAIEQKNRQDLKDLDDIYRQLQADAPPLKSNGTP